MGSHADCKNWDYEDHPEAARVTARCKKLTELLRKRPKRFNRYGYDTRRGHVFMFTGMAPDACSCIIGRYRGADDCAALTNYPVRVGQDPRVGVDPRLVLWQVGAFETRTREACEEFEKSRADGTPPDKAFLGFTRLLCDALEAFFWIHPYANGNGHSGRLLLWVLMTRHGFPPRNWPLDESPEYGSALTSYRDGTEKLNAGDQKGGLALQKPLQRFIMKAIRGF